MKYPIIASFLLWIAVLMIAAPAPAAAQGLSDKAQQFWENFQKMSDLGDEKGMKRSVIHSKNDALEVFDTYIVLIVDAKATIKELGYVKALARHLSGVSKTKLYTFKVEYMTNLSAEDCRKWANAWDFYVKAFAAYNEGKENQNVFKLDEGQELFKKALAGYEALGDKVLQAEVIVHLAECYDALEQPYEACVEYKRALDLIGTLDFTHPYQLVAEPRYTKYIEQGYDPTKPKDEGGTPDSKPEETVDPETGEKVLKKPEFKLGDASENWTLKYTPMKNPSEFKTPAYNTGYNPYLWPASYYNAAEKDMDRFNPFYSFGISFYGKNWNVSAVKNKFYFSVDGEPKTRAEIKAISKPTKVILTDIEKGEDNKPIKYQLFVQSPGSQEVMFGFSQNNASLDPKIIRVRSRTGCYTKGKVLGENFILIDDNCSGIFGDYYYMERDAVTYGDYTHWRCDAMLIGREKIARPFSTYARIGDKFYYLSPDKYGQKLTTTEADVKTGTIRLVYEGDMAPSHLVLRLVDENNPGVFFNVAGSKDPVVLPVGEYEIACGKIQEFKRNARQIRIYHGRAEYIHIYAGEETVLELGAPFTFTFETSDIGKEYIVDGKSVQVWGKRGELYTQFFDEIPQPEVFIRAKDSGKVLVKGDKMRLCALEDYIQDSTRLCYWYPKDYIYANKKGGELEARLEAKSVKLLGGPITSEWK